MKIVSILFLCLFFCKAIYTQNLYVKTFGNQKNKAIVFLHGGPGYNCANFEATTAKILADQGYFVIVYDRRGEGRSEDKNAQFTFNESFEDLNFILKKYELKKVSLIGHSFGGILGTLYSEKYSENIECLFLVGAPISLQETFQNIIEKTKAIYTSKNDSVNLKYIAYLEKMDTNSLAYSSYCFSHAMQNKFYSTKNPNQHAEKIYSSFKTDTLLATYAKKMTFPPTQGFWNNEKYTTLNLEKNIQNCKDNKISVFGLYGKEDGLYSEIQISKLQKQLGESNLKYFENCSHNVFIDQQAEFISSITSWMKELK